MLSRAISWRSLSVSSSEVASAASRVASDPVRRGLRRARVLLRRLALLQRPGAAGPRRPAGTRRARPPAGAAGWPRCAARRPPLRRLGRLRASVQLARLPLGSRRRAPLLAPPGSRRDKRCSSSFSATARRGRGRQRLELRQPRAARQEARHPARPRPLGRRGQQPPLHPQVSRGWRPATRAAGPRRAAAPRAPPPPSARRVAGSRSNVSSR